MSGTNGKTLSPEEVLDLAARAERVAARAESHPLLGPSPDDLLDEDPVVAAARLPAEPPPPPRARSYCDSCGYVDAHAPDCPQQVAADLRADEARERALERKRAAEDPAILPLVRQLAGALLRRVARAIEGR